MADHTVAFMLQTLLTMLQMLVQKSTAPLPQLHVAKSTAENKQKGNQVTMATMLGGSYSLLLVYFVAEVKRHLQARHMYYSVSSGSSVFVWTEDFFENGSF